MGDKVLYFPYIAVPEDVWFTQVLLYWDEIGTIVPRSVLDQPDLLGSYTAGLIRERLLSPIDPGRYLDQLPHSELVQEFLRVVEEDPVLRNLKDQLPDLRTDGREFERLPGTDVVPRRALGRSPPGTSFVHVDKAGHPLMDELVEKKLAQHVAGPEFDRWFLVEERTASLFMAYLASLLGAMEEVGMDPMTDEIRALNAFSYLGMGLPNEPVEAQGALAEADRLQLEIVRDILPAPLTPVDPADLADFKADSENVERRRKLRTMIEGSERCSRCRRPSSPWQLRPTPQPSALGIPGLLGAVRTVVGDLRRRKRAMASPLVYAVLAGKRFGTA